MLAPSPRLAPLRASQHQELGIGGQNFPYRILEFGPGFDAPADVLDPILGNVLHVLLAIHHESERPDGMAGALGAVAGGLAAADMRLGKGAGKEIVRKLKPTHQFELALAELRSLRPLDSSVILL